MDPTNVNPAEVLETGANESVADSETPSYVTASDLQSFKVEIGKAIGNDVRRLMAGMLKTQPAGKMSTPPASTPSAEPAAEMMTSEVPDVRSMMDRERNILRSIHRNGFSEEQEDLVRTMIDAANPEDVNAFVADMATKFGIAKAGSTETGTQNTEANPTPASNGGLPGMTRTEQSDEQPVWEWSKEKVEQWMRQNGGARAFRAYVSQRMQQDGRGVRLSLKEG